MDAVGTFYEAVETADAAIETMERLLNAAGVEHDSNARRKLRSAQMQIEDVREAVENYGLNLDGDND